MPLTTNAAAPGQTLFHTLLAMGLGATVGFAYFAEDWISAGFVFFVMVMVYFGYWSGMVKIASSVVGLLAAIRFAQPLAPHIVEICDRIFSPADAYRQPISVAVAGVLIAVIVGLLFRLVAHFVFQWIPHWEGIDRWIGAALGAVQGATISVIVLFGAMMLEPVARQHSALNSEGPSAGLVDQWPDQLLSFTERTRESSVGTVMDAMDPVRDRFNQRFEKMKNAVVTDSETGNPVQQRMRQLVQEFRNNVAAQKILSKKSGLDEDTLRSILESPQIERAIDDGSVTKGLSKAWSTND